LMEEAHEQGFLTEAWKQEARYIQEQLERFQQQSDSLVERERAQEYMKELAVAEKTEREFGLWFFDTELGKAYGDAMEFGGLPLCVDVRSALEGRMAPKAVTYKAFYNTLNEDIKRRIIKLGGDIKEQCE